MLEKEGKKPLQATVSFPDRLFIWNGLVSTLNLSYELISIPETNMGLFHAWY